VANLIQALYSLDREQIAESGRPFVEREYTLEKTVENWKKISQNIE